MSSGRKCKNCGSFDIEVDPARGDAVCTNCGSVLDDNFIIAEVQFEEGAHGTSSAIGQFVSAESKGGAASFNSPFHLRLGVESREITLKKAKNGITNLCNQLRLNQHHIETACSFFKMALSRNLTRGRRNTHVYAACVYLTCRTEGTAHLLIDISDVLQICCYELGRTYLRLSQALCINIPSVDPCLYILRFAAKLEFGPKTQQVSNTALRLVQRMKRDSIHSGRRPSGLCGAALLIASRLHEFSRSTRDIVKIVKVHESTLRKRLIEFGDTPSSALTLDEFMTVDLEEEQDPPSFKAARKKDKERLQKLIEEEVDSITELQREIEEQLTKSSTSRSKSANKSNEIEETNCFIQESIEGTIEKIISEETVDDPNNDTTKELGPNIASMGLAKSLEDTSNAVQSSPALAVDMSLDDIDDDEIDTYIMSENEYQKKNGLWHELNASYLEELKIKEERLRKEKEEGKPEKKKRKTAKKKHNAGPANSAGEAIEKILQEKRISSKINYDVLKTLTALPVKSEADNTSTFSSEYRMTPSPASSSGEPPAKQMKVSAPNKRTKAKEAGASILTANAEENIKKTENPVEDDLEEDYEEDDGQVPEESTAEMGVMEIMRQHREDAEEAADDYSGYSSDDI